MALFRSKLMNPICLLMLIALCSLHIGQAQAIAEQSTVDLPLQDILDRAGPGETIILPEGTYEGPITISKPLTIRAEREGAVVLRNNSMQTAVTIEAEGTILSGIHIEDETFKEEPTVLVTADSVLLENLHIRTGAHGIAARDASDGSVTGSTIIWAPQGIRMADKGNGIDLLDAHRWKLTNNAIRDVHDAIYMESSDDGVITDNVVESSRYGIHTMFSKRTVIERNIGKMNVTGAMVMTAEQTSVKDNTFVKQSENVNSQGILLYDAHQITVSGNAVEGNRVGIYMEQSTGNRLEGNQVNSNFIGLQLVDASGNEIRANRFFGNVTDAQARGSEHNTIADNYWDSFEGIDADGDGKSDIAYAMNPFFASVAQKRPAFQLFFQSPGMVFLESLFQSGREGWSMDASPLMKPPASGYMLEPSDDSRTLTGWTGLVLLGCTSVFILMMRRRKA